MTYKTKRKRNQQTKRIKQRKRKRNQQTKQKRQQSLFRQQKGGGGSGLFSNASYYLNHILSPSKSLLPFEGHYSQK